LVVTSTGGAAGGAAQAGWPLSMASLTLRATKGGERSQQRHQQARIAVVRGREARSWPPVGTLAVGVGWDERHRIAAGVVVDEAASSSALITRPDRADRGAWPASAFLSAFPPSQATG
jgi:hypothetical protein